MEIRDNGRLISAETIAKMYGTRRSNIEKRWSRPINMHELADSVAEQNGMQKMTHSTRMTKQVLAAVKPKNLRMKANGIPASLRMFKLAHRQPRELHGDFLPDLLKINLPPQSANGMNDDETSDDGAELAHDAVDDERTPGTRPNVVGSTAVVGVADSAAINAASLSAIKRAQRNPKVAFLR